MGKELIAFFASGASTHKTLNELV